MKQTHGKTKGSNFIFVYYPHSRLSRQMGYHSFKKGVYFLPSSTNPFSSYFLRTRNPSFLSPQTTIPSSPELKQMLPFPFHFDKEGEKPASERSPVSSSENKQSIIQNCSISNPFFKKNPFHRYF